jgi:hypothetical protein
MRSVTAAALGVLLAWTRSAAALMPPEVYEEGRNSAPYHLEVRIVAMTPDDDPIGQCAVEAVVETVHRDGSARLAPGDAVTFDVDCVRADADPNQILDGVLYERVEDLAPGTLLDVYLTDAFLGYEVVLGQVTVIGEAPVPAED